MVIVNLTGTRITCEVGLWAYLWSIIKLNEVGRPGNCGWHHALCSWVVQNWRQQAEHSWSCIPLLYSDWRSNTTNYLKLLLPWLPSHDGLNLKLWAKIISFASKLLLSEYLPWQQKNKLRHEGRGDHKVNMGQMATDNQDKNMAAS